MGMKNSENFEIPQIPIATNYFNQLYLFAFATRAEVLHHIRTQTIEDEKNRIPEIIATWEKLQKRVEELKHNEHGIAEEINVEPIPDEYHPKLTTFTSDPLFKKTFAGRPIDFGVVEVDKLVAPQRTVNLDYIDRLIESYPKSPTFNELLDICVSPKRKMDPIQHLEIAPNTHVFSSPNSDIRFLGAFVKQLTVEDLNYAEFGGLPAAAVIAFIGYGGAPVNVFQVGKRIILNNGFHRVYALRSLGITEIPVVIQHVRNPQLELPEVIAGLPREYLIYEPRPVLIKDFFEPDFTIKLRVRERIKIVTVSIAVNQHEVPS